MIKGLLYPFAVMLRMFISFIRLLFVIEGLELLEALKEIITKSRKKRMTLKIR
jgi:hypothetical protein